jgi:two-component system sensor histidine kinase and response regulator WspE
MNDDSILELFRQEVETQVSILSQELLKLESHPEAMEIDTLLRSAHSLKGAARISSLDGIVKLAHSLEDCFVALQNHQVLAEADLIDTLLHSIDWLQQLSQVPEIDLLNWLTDQTAEMATLQSAIAALIPADADQRRSQSLTTGEPSALSRELQQADQTLETTLNAVAVPSDRVVRVSAENLNRIMGLAGESLVEATWLQPFADSFTALKSRQKELAQLLDAAHTALADSSGNSEGQQFLDQARRKAQECRELLGDRLSEIELYARRTTSLSDRLYQEVITSHMRPFTDGVEGFPRMVRDLARQLGKQVKLDVVGKGTPVDRDILKKLEAPLTHILRNAIDHGIELPADRVAAGKSPEGTIRLEAFHRGGMLAITVSDDGRGIDLNQLRQQVVDRNLATVEMVARFTEAELLEFLFLPGFSTSQQVTEISGRGVGLDIAKNMVQEVGGTVRVASYAQKSTSFYFQLPLTLSVVRTLLVEISGEPYAFPLARVDQIVRVDRSDISVVEGRHYFTKDGINIGLIAAHQVLELPEIAQIAEALCVVVISDPSNAYGLVVDKFLGEKDLVVRPLDPRFGKVRDISASALMDDGSPILIVDVFDLIQSTDSLLNSGRLSQVELNQSQVKRKRILVVDDSITVREMERKLLQSKGYDVDIAVNGVDGWSAIRTKNYDLVISDIDMPRMNGIELTRQVKTHPRLHSTPIIIVSYRDSEDDRLQGLEAGADYYLTKSSFEDDTLTNAVAQLIGY